jgi:hypothetical protein
MKIIKKQIEVMLYVTERGDEIPLSEMVPLHLLNAYAKAMVQDDKEIAGILRAEAVKRMTYVP